ncbi:thioredoxin family protein [Bacillus taeanensis]|uniref:Thioredoxin n=1 Tax=Bacillus taeanensis TaxID=273032 RepID=A0A366XZA4_9BACI|nr:thioredoxin family protein [Bacillus taeanensis]RBW71257.1 thioredoxin [Bacillus taeanensis]
MLQEVSEERFKELLTAEEPVIVFFYTPLCGTCKLAGRMLDVVLETLQLPFPAAACNLNIMPKAAEKYQIMSVPCLMVFHHGKLKEKMFRFQSVEHLYSSLGVYGQKNN